MELKEDTHTHMANSTRNKLCGKSAVVDGNMKVKRSICGIPFVVEAGDQVYCVNRLCSETPLRSNRKGHCTVHAAQHRAETATTESDSDSESDVGEDDVPSMHDENAGDAISSLDESIRADNVAMPDDSTSKHQLGASGGPSKAGKGAGKIGGSVSCNALGPMPSLAYGTRSGARSGTITDCEPNMIYSMRPAPFDTSKLQYLVQWTGHTFLDASWEFPAFLCRTVKGAQLLETYRKQHSMGNFYESMHQDEVTKQPVLTSAETEAIPEHWVPSSKRRRAEADPAHPGTTTKQGRRSARADKSAEAPSSSLGAGSITVCAIHATHISNPQSVSIDTLSSNGLCPALNQPAAALVTGSVVPATATATSTASAAMPADSSRDINKLPCTGDLNEDMVGVPVVSLPLSTAGMVGSGTAALPVPAQAKPVSKKRPHKPKLDENVAKKAKFTFTPCSARERGKMEEQERRRRYRSCGVICMYCICGHMFPPLEVVGFESVSEIHKYVMCIWDGHSFKTERTAAASFIIVYDDACHLLPFSRNPVRVNDDSPTLVKELANDVRMVVDKFHFNENHTGDYCTANCSPHALPELDDVTANTQVAEQSFKNLAEFKKVFRYMNKARFNFMLMLVCKLTRELREKE